MSSKTDAERVSEIVEAVQQKYSLSDSEKSKLERDFFKISDGIDVLTLAQAKAATEESVKNKYADYVTSRPSLIRSITRRQLGALDSKDLDKDGNISKDEFIKGEQYLNMLKSMNMSDSNYDLMMEKAELVNWIKDLGVSEPDLAADAAIGAFLKATESDLKIDGLLDGLFGMAFGGKSAPTSSGPEEAATNTTEDQARVNDIVAAVQREFTSKFEDRLLSREFSQLSGGNDVISMADAKKATEAAVEELYQDYVVNPDKKDTLERLKKRRTDALLKKDLNSDGSLTKEEFIKGGQYLSLLHSLKFKDYDFDSVMDQPEFVTWLERLNVASAEMAADAALRTFTKAGETELLVEDLADRLFELATQ